MFAKSGEDNELTPNERHQEFGIQGVVREIEYASSYIKDPVDRAKNQAEILKEARKRLEIDKHL